MCKDLAVVMDVAGTILRMYRVAKDIEKGVIRLNVVTWELIMEKKGRVLVVPQMDPALIFSCRPYDNYRDTWPVLHDTPPQDREPWLENDLECVRLHLW